VDLDLYPLIHLDEVDRDNFRFTIFNPFCDFIAVDRDYKFIICTDRETVSSSAGHEIACTVMQPKATAAVGSSLAVKRTNTL